MEHKPLAELQAIADITLPDTQTSMTREQRVERWIGLLRSEARAQGSLPSGDRASLRHLLFAESKECGAVPDMHEAFCSCHLGIMMTRSEAARRLRRVMRRDAFRKKVTSALAPVVGRLFRTA
jgi:hypothetical protein